VGFHPKKAVDSLMMKSLSSQTKAPRPMGQWDEAVLDMVAKFAINKEPSSFV
jgi:hypothetical protein